MKYNAKQWLALLALTAVLQSVLPADARQRVVLPHPASTTTLDKLTGIDVNPYNLPLVQGQNVGADLMYTTIKELRFNPVLPYKNPSDAILSFECQNFDCTKVRAKVTLRSEGGPSPNAPELWSYELSGFKWSWLPYYKQEPEVLGRQIVERLTTDYLKAKLEAETAMQQSTQQLPSPSDVLLTPKPEVIMPTDQPSHSRIEPSEPQAETEPHPQH